MSGGRALRAAAVVAVPAVLVALAVLSPRPPGVSGPKPDVVGAAESHIPAAVVVGHGYLQPFGAVADGLSEVGIYADPGGKGAPTPLNAEVLANGVAIRRATGVYLPGHDTVRFAFEPLAQSGGRSLSLRVTSTATSPAAAFTLYFVAQPPPGTPHLLQDGADTGGYLPLRLRYGAPVPAARQLLAISDRASQYHPSAFKTPAPLVVAALTVLTATGLMLVLSGALPLTDRRL